MPPVKRTFRRLMPAEPTFFSSTNSKSSLLNPVPRPAPTGL
jgi:hypothetical protein